MIISVFDRVQNIVGKGEIACTSSFPFPTMFSKGFFPKLIKRCHCVGMGNVQVSNPGPSWPSCVSVSSKSTSAQNLV